MSILIGNKSLASAFLGDAEVSSIWLGNDLIYEKTVPCQCLCFTANTAGSTVILSYNDTPTLGQSFSISRDNGNTWSSYTLGSTITLTNAGDKVWFKGNCPNGLSEIIPYYIKASFRLSGSVAGSGNIMSLIDNGACSCLTIPNQYCFQELFSSQSALTSAPSLPATRLTNYCYSSMFSYCTGLTTMPALPAIYVADRCYEYMFQGCSALCISDSSGSGYSQQFHIPSSGNFALDYTSYYSFKGCSGTRSSNDINCISGTNLTYYTQNTPI